MSHLHKWSPNEFARYLCESSKVPDKHFAFFLGAGCSVSSGIPTAGSLVNDSWLPRLRNRNAPDRKDLGAWIIEQFPDYKPENAADFYGPVMDLLFPMPDDRQMEIETQCHEKYPTFGYAMLASLIARDGGHFNIVITTNFDDLIADALYLFTTARPLVIAHESLAGFIRPTRTRPLVVKLHGDAHLEPHNTADETASLQEEVQRPVAGLLHDRGLIVMGYGGNDKGIKNMLEGLPKEALPFGVFWVSHKEPQGIMRPWLETRKAFWIESADFDETMLLVKNAFELPHPDRKRIEAVFENYEQAYKKFTERIRPVAEKAEDKTLKRALDKADKDLPGSFFFILNANAIKKEAPEAANQLYQEGIRLYPESAPLLGSYATYLWQIPKYYDQAEKLYQRSLQADPIDANNLANYASFLLSLGNFEKGYPLLQQVIDMHPQANLAPLEVETWFYAFAHWPTEKRASALKELKRTLLKEIRSPGWDLSANIERAKLDGHPDTKWLQVLADVIAKDEDIAKLDAWDKWKNV